MEHTPRVSNAHNCPGAYRALRLALLIRIMIGAPYHRAMETSPFSNRLDPPVATPNSGTPQTEGVLIRVFLLVLDSVGMGEAPDAADYGDSGANTLAHTAEAVGGLTLPTLQAMGLGTIPSFLPHGLPIRGVAPVSEPTASFGAMCPLSKGKDTTTGHWELVGLQLVRGLSTFPPGPPSFPEEVIRAFERRTGRPVIGNRAASGTQIIAELGEQQRRNGCWIVYTSADSVFQIAAHEEVIPLEELYRACHIARELCDPLRVGRIIARPYVGKPGAFHRTDNRRDFSLPPPGLTLLDALGAHGIPVTAIGKIDDLFANRGISRSLHVENNAEAQAALLDVMAGSDRGLIFANFIDFDMRYGHRRDPVGYARALEQMDAFLGEFRSRLRPGDCLIVTADHGNDPTFRGTDHTREWVPLLIEEEGKSGASLGVAHGFFTVAGRVAARFELTDFSPPVLIE